MLKSREIGGNIIKIFNCSGEIKKCETCVVKSYNAIAMCKMTSLALLHVVHGLPSNYYQWVSSNITWKWILNFVHSRKPHCNSHLWTNGFFFLLYRDTVISCFSVYGVCHIHTQRAKPIKTHLRVVSIKNTLLHTRWRSNIVFELYFVAMTRKRCIRVILLEG